MMITTFCHNSECHTDNQWICHKLLMSSLLFLFKFENISLYYLCMCRPHQLEQMRAIGLWEIWPESNENHQYLILISLRLDGNPLLGFKWIELFKQLHIKDHVCICSHVIFCKTYANMVGLQNLAKVKVELEQTAER